MVHWVTIDNERSDDELELSGDRRTASRLEVPKCGRVFSTWLNARSIRSIPFDDTDSVHSFVVRITRWPQSVSNLWVCSVGLVVRASEPDCDEFTCAGAAGYNEWSYGVLARAGVSYGQHSVAREVFTYGLGDCVRVSVHTASGAVWYTKNEAQPAVQVFVLPAAARRSGSLFACVSLVPGVETKLEQCSWQ